MAPRLVRRFEPLLLLLGSLSLPIEAQLPVSALPPVEDVLAPEDFGSDTQNLIVGALEFIPRNNLVSAGLNGRIPNGARITSICLYGVDNDPSDDFSLLLHRVHAEAVGGADPDVEVTGPIFTTGAPGDFAQCMNVNILVRSRYDIDGDGVIELVDYSLIVFNSSSSRSIRFVRIAWHRQVSPAPTSATFADVPVGHPFHQFVEALVASGITAGCGGGNFCVNNPISRGEMAVFLAAALGLHWPAF
jgi:hypothetical protein